MDEGLGYVAFEPKRQQMLELPAGVLPQGSPVSEHTQQRIDDAIRGIVMAGFDHATAILTLNREVLDRGARALLDKETIDEAAIRALAQDLKQIDATGAAP
jgi:cell division protease FtsH